jgi:hypothetical protein
MKSFLIILTISPLVLFGRVWTNTEGKQFEGTYIEQSDATVKIRGEQNYKLYDVSISVLSSEDQIYLKSQLLASDLEEAKKEAKNKKMILCFYHNDSAPEIFDEFLSYYVAHEDFSHIPDDIVVLALGTKNLSDFKPNDPFMKDMKKRPALVFMTPNGRDFYSTWASSSTAINPPSLKETIERAREVLAKMRNR